jgi:hypothetical protein
MAVVGRKLQQFWYLYAAGSTAACYCCGSRTNIFVEGVRTEQFKALNAIVLPRSAQTYRRPLCQSCIAIHKIHIDKQPAPVKKPDVESTPKMGSSDLDSSQFDFSL